MNAKRCLLTALCAVSFLAAISAVKADDLDEKQANLSNKVNQAAANKRLSSKDASAIRKEIGKFDEKKLATRSAHGGVLTEKDDKDLDTRLSDINQHYEEKVKPEVKVQP